MDTPMTTPTPVPTPVTTQLSAGQGNCVVCKTQIEPGRLMCLPHWRLVPAALTAQIGSSQRRYRMARTSQGRRDSLISLRNVQRQAIAAVVAADLSPDPTNIPKECP